MKTLNKVSTGFAALFLMGIIGAAASAPASAYEHFYHRGGFVVHNGWNGGHYGYGLYAPRVVVNSGYYGDPYCPYTNNVIVSDPYYSYPRYYASYGYYRPNVYFDYRFNGGRHWRR